MRVGIDEAGRGCWAGPLVAAAVSLKRPLEGLTDSKQLSPKKRIELAKIIKRNSWFGIGWVSAHEIDSIGLTAATTKAMEDALSALPQTYNEVVIDGTYNYLPHIPEVMVLAKADLLIQEVSAASIIAKVARDTYMNELAVTSPEYQFEKHVGYGTALHHQLLKQHGITEHHRLSYKPVVALLEKRDD